MRLCFGTFARVLQLCKLDVVTDPRLVGTMTRTIDPNCQYIKSENATSVHRLLNCTGNLSPGNIADGGIGVMRRPGTSISSILILAPRADRADLTQKFADNVIGLLDENKKLNAVLAILNIIERDEVIDDDSASGKKRSFEKYVGTTKIALLSQSDYVLSDLLAGIFLFTVAAGVVNTVGKESIDEITPEYIGGLENLRHINVTDFMPIPDITVTQDILPAELPFPADTFLSYISNVRTKYSTIKTLLYNDQPKPFYDFYVCNNITWRERAEEKRVPFRRTLIVDANIKKLGEISHFIFITGAGGLGKSMMMRHLLLNAIDNYEDFKLIPVFIPLKDFDNTSGKLLEYIYTKVEDFGDGISKLDFENVLTAGRCLLLFDGLDEIGTNNVGFFERELGSFTDKYSNNYYVISSRPYQSFVSFERFCVLRLLPFNIEQALHLIDNLDFRPDDPSIKAKFRDELSKRLYKTHRTFTENPLLLTIMLMTFEMFAEVPSQMHIFYREAFNALSRTHDANKGAYKRELKSKLSVDAFADVFAEICFRTYWDEKFEFSMPEFESYFQRLTTIYAKSVLAEDFMYDLCYSLCLMYLESGKYYFTHRSFQEYFSAVFLSKQKDSVISRLGAFFEKRERRMRGDQTFFMLNDLIPDKVDEFIFIPYLDDLFSKCDKGEGYWTFLEEMYPVFEYDTGETPIVTHNLPNSFLFTCLLSFLRPPNSTYYKLRDLPEYDEFLETTYYWLKVGSDEDEVDIVEESRVPSEYVDSHGEPDVAGYHYSVELSTVLEDTEHYSDFVKMLNDDNFVYKIQYRQARECLEQLKSKQKSSDATLLDLL